MENVNAEEEAAVLGITPERIPNPNTPPTSLDVPPDVKPEKKQSLRESLEKNFKESEDTEVKPSNKVIEDKKEDKKELTTVNKSFVNGEAQQKPQEVVAAPASMNASERKIWDTLPIEAKKFISRRDYETRSDYSRKTEGLNQKEKEAADVLSAVTPEVRQEYTRDGIAVSDLVRRSIAWDKRVKEGLDGAIEFLQAYGYTGDQLANHLLYNNNQSVTPEYLTKEEALELARKEVQDQLNLNQQSVIAEQNVNALQSFLDSKSIFKGDPGTAHQFEVAMAEEVEYLKFRQYQGSIQQLLELAYQRAVANNPAFSGLGQQSQQQTAKPENIYEQMERVRSAKAASKSASGNLGSGSPTSKSNSLRESLERNWAKS